MNIVLYNFMLYVAPPLLVFLVPGPQWLDAVLLALWFINVGLGLSDYVQY